MIRVIYRNGEEELVSPKFLDILLHLNQVQLFERKAGWVVVGVDELRKTSSQPYSGSELRKHITTPLPAPVDPGFWQRCLSQEPNGSSMNRRQA